MGDRRGRASLLECYVCRTAVPNPCGIPRDARSPAHGAPGPVPVRSRFRDLGRRPRRACGREVPFPEPQRHVRDCEPYGRRDGPDCRNLRRQHCEEVVDRGAYLGDVSAATGVPELLARDGRRRPVAKSSRSASAAVEAHSYGITRDRGWVAARGCRDSCWNLRAAAPHCSWQTKQ